MLNSVSEMPSPHGGDVRMLRFEMLKTMGWRHQTMLTDVTMQQHSDIHTGSPH
jgi:hypothetical protein